MVSTPAGGRSRLLRRAAAVAAVAGLLATAAACTGADVDAPAPSAPSASRPATTLEARSAPARIRVTRVSGELADRDREALARNVGVVLRRWFDDAYLGGDQPRSDFDDAFATFTPGARRSARKDRAVLTNRALGPTTEQIVVRRRSAYLSVLAPYRVAAGVTARVRLEYVAVRADRPDKHVTVHGRLLLTRRLSGGWAVFGYDLDRSVRPVRAGEAS